MKNTFFVLFLLASIVLSAQKKKVACIGDSVTFGMGIDQRETNSYPAQLQVLLGANYQVENFGKNSATLLTKGYLPYVKQEEYKKAIAFAGDFVIIHLGLNDTDPRNWVNYRDDFIQDYLNLIEDFRKSNPKAKIWICRMTPITHDHSRFISGTRDWYWQIQNAIEQIAVLSKTELIDFQEPLYNYPNLLPDALHPNKEGAALIAKKVYGALTGNYGGLQMPDIYSDNMILQRNTPLSIEGIANAKEEISVAIEKIQSSKKKGKSGIVLQKMKVKTAANGKWTAQFSPFEAGRGYQLRISSNKKTILYKNVAFGDVYLCSGQSNMTFPLKKEASFNKNNDYSNANISIFNMQARWETLDIKWNKNVLDSLNRLEYYKPTSWQPLSDENAENLSAIAYFFGKEISQNENVPIGLIQNSVDGSNIEAWIDRKTLEFEIPEILRNWTRNDLIMKWVRERAMLNVGSKEGNIRHPYEPAYLFEAGILPLKKYPIAGVLWYQGESNAHNIETYERLFPLFIESWRNYWNNEKLPFYVVQLSSINRPSWGYFRNSQRTLCKEIPNIHMAISSDLGVEEDVHPPKKMEVGQRLAHLALRNFYNKKDIILSPEYKSVTKKGEEVLITFDKEQVLQTSDGKSLQGFEVAEIDGLYYPAEAHIIENNLVKVVSKNVKNPKFVRYNFAPFANGNLINVQKLPVSTFKIILE